MSLLCGLSQFKDHAKYVASSMIVALREIRCPQIRNFRVMALPLRCNVLNSICEHYVFTNSTELAFVANAFLFLRFYSDIALRFEILAHALWCAISPHNRFLLHTYKAHISACLFPKSQRCSTFRNKFRAQYRDPHPIIHGPKLNTKCIHRWKLKQWHCRVSTNLERKLHS